MNLILSKLKGDKVLWIVALFLAIASIIAVYSSIGALAYKTRGGNTEAILFKHLIMLVSGFLLMFAVHRIPYSLFAKLSNVLLILSIVLLIMTLAIGVSLNNAHRWLEIPIVNLSFQTSDLAKISLIIWVARKLSVSGDQLNDFKEGVLPILWPILVVCALIFPANFSTAAMLFVNCIVLMFIGRVKVLHIGYIFGSAVGILAFFLLFVTAFPSITPARMGTWKNRIINFSNEDNISSDAKYQVIEAKKAIVNGGFMGEGIAQGVSKNSMPHPYSDMIYAFIIEEFGSIIGGFSILILYLMLFNRSLKIANASEKKFGAYLAIGLGFSLTLQAFINMAVAVNLFPVTGQPLPLISMGGTSTWFTCLSIGVILSVSSSSSKLKEAEDE